MDSNSLKQLEELRDIAKDTSDKISSHQKIELEEMRVNFPLQQPMEM